MDSKPGPIAMTGKPERPNKHKELPMVTAALEIIIGSILVAASLSVIHDLLYERPHLEPPLQERLPDAGRHN
jgi:hypothetical protein